MAKTQLTIYSVSQVNALVAAAIEERVPSRLTVRGQISDFKVHSSGHCYFSLKDEGSVLSCVMWASKFRTIKFRPENGLAVLATGSVEVYVQSGRYQLYVDKLDPAGVGSLQLAFEQLKTKLHAEGLFDEDHKKPLPKYPMCIGVITSASGAAIEDIRNSIFKRWPCARLYLFDVPVQGEGASAKIAVAIRKANQMQKKLGMELLIVGRGGGSMEDLWAFNEEPVARAIYNSRLPVISAVGHEVDFTIADFVADVRASTPTQAGVLAVPDKTEVLLTLDAACRHLDQAVKGELRYLKSQLQTILADGLFRDPRRFLQNSILQLDDCYDQLDSAIRDRVSCAFEVLSRSERQVARIEPMRVLYVGSQKLNSAENRLFQGIRLGLSKNQLQMTAVENRLQAMNPKAVLERGYSITVSRRTNRVVVSSRDVQAGDVMITELAHQEKITSVVKDPLGRE
jgi:exodeoxyribonuclease VII large subunit